MGKSSFIIYHHFQSCRRTPLLPTASMNASTSGDSAVSSRTVGVRCVNIGGCRGHGPSCARIPSCKGSSGWSGIMLLRRQWLPQPLLPLQHPPPLPLTLPPPRPAGARWCLVDDRPLLPSQQTTCIPSRCFCHCHSCSHVICCFVLSSEVCFFCLCRDVCCHCPNCNVHCRTSDEIGNGSGVGDDSEDNDSPQERQMASMAAERDRLWMEHNNHPNR